MNLNKNFYFFDCYHPESKTIIEFHGDLFHANPKVYGENGENFKSIFNLNFDIIKEKDTLKSRLVLENNLRLIIIWEAFYKANKDKCLQITKDLIKSNFTGIREFNV